MVVEPIGGGSRGMGDMSPPPKFFSGASPLKFQGGKKI